MAQSSENSFGLVVFNTLPEFFPTDSNVECNFTITSGVQASTWDWVGLYKVGWSAKNQHIIYEWVPALPEHEASRDNKLRVVFPAKSLPKEEGEFYQFVYIANASGTTIGCSTPFQFRKPRATDFVEEEVDDMLFVRSKACVMQEKIQQLETELLVVVQERDQLERKVSALEVEAEQRGRSLQRLEDDLAASRSSEKALIHAHDERVTQLEEMYRLKEEGEQQALLAVHQMREACAKGTALEGQIKALQSEKDALSGQNQSLLNEMAVYKEQVTQSQTLTAGKTKEVAELTAMLQELSDKAADTEEALQQLGEVDRSKTVALVMKQQELTASMTALKDLQVECDSLKSEVQNSADMLLACQSMKEKMRDDMAAYEQTQGRMSNMVEAQESSMRQVQHNLRKKTEECDNLSTLLQGLEKELEEKTGLLANTQIQVANALGQFKDAQAQLAVARTENVDAKRELQASQRQLEATAAECSSVKTKAQSLAQELHQVRQHLQEKSLAEDSLQKQEAQRTEAQKEEQATKELIIAETLKQISRMEEEVDKVKDELSRRDAEIKSKSKDITALQTKVQCQDQELAARDDEIKKLTADGKKSLNKVCAQKQQMKEMEQAQEQKMQQIEKSQEKKIQEMGKEMQKTIVLVPAIDSTPRQLHGNPPATHHHRFEITAEGQGHSSDEEAEGSKYALLVANRSLKGRLGDKNTELDALRGEKRQWEAEMVEKCIEVTELRERLTQAREEFTKLMLQFNKTQRKLHKYKEAKRSAAASSAAAAAAAGSGGVGVVITTAPTSSIPIHSCPSLASSTSSSPTSSSPPTPSPLCSAPLEPPRYRELYHAERKRALELERQTEFLKLQVGALKTELGELQKGHADLADVCFKMSEENKCLANFNFQKDTHIESLEKKLQVLKVAEEDTPESAFHDSLASNPWARCRSSSRNEGQKEGQEEVQGAQALNLIYPNPYAAWIAPQSGDDTLRAALDLTAKKGAAVFVPTTEEDVTPTFLRTPSCSSSEDSEESDLPAPLDPEVMPQAKVAALKQLIGCAGCASDADEQLLFEDCSPEMPAAMEESFMDAIGEGMSVCPQCQESVLSSGAFQEHQAAHLGRLCPVCKSVADDSMSQEHFEQHVNKCCEVMAQATAANATVQKIERN